MPYPSSSTLSDSPFNQCSIMMGGEAFDTDSPYHYCLSLLAVSITGGDSSSMIDPAIALLAVYHASHATRGGPWDVVSPIPPGGRPTWLARFSLETGSANGITSDHDSA
jgi:hypothetical protein